NGADAFQLHDTHGVYIDITEQMASEVGLTVDRKAFEEEMEQAKEKARGAQKKFVVSAVTGELPKTDDSPKYQDFITRGKILGWGKENPVVRSEGLHQGEELTLRRDSSKVHAERGGQGTEGEILSRCR